MRLARRASLVVAFYVLILAASAWAGGWYLMLPPLTQDSNDKALPAPWRPVSEWELHQTFDTAAACEEGRDRLIRALGRMYSSGLSPQEVHPNPRQAFAARCIATDDPRLKDTVDPSGPKGGGR